MAAATLQEILLAPETKPKVLTDCYALVDQQVADKSGVSGTALKLGYKTVTSFAPGYFHGTVEGMLPQIVATLEPFWALLRVRRRRVRRLPGQARRGSV